MANRSNGAARAHGAHGSGGAGSAKGPPAKVETLRALRDSLRYTARTLGVVWRSSPRLTFGLGALTLLGAVVPPGIALAGKRIVDAVVAHDRDLAIRWVMIELGLVTLQATISRALSLVTSTLGSRLGTDINVTILERATKLALVHFEDSEFYDRMSKARREASTRPLSLVRESFALVQSVLTLIGYGALLVKFSGLIVLVLLVSTIPATVAEMRFSKTAFRMRNWRSPDSRRLVYYEYVLANDEHAKEVKLFSLGELFLGRYKALAEKFHTDDTKLAVRRTIYGHLLSMLGTIAFYGAYGLMAALAALSRLTLGSMTMYVLAFRSGQQAFQSILSGIGSMYEHNLYMSNLFAFLDQSSEREAAPNAPASPELVAKPVVAEPVVDHEVGELVAAPVVPGARGIVLDHVSFKYPGSDKYVLEDVSLAIPEGQAVALVGQNGAGKTTFVKLLTRLYEPTSGRILLDGRDLKDWDESQLRARFGVVFQDFNQYQLRVRENVGVGSVTHMEDTERLTRAVARGGAEPVISGLAAGLETSLGRWFQDGVELSGGQWQKIALARGFMREEANILVLDEPTAALDAEAEHAVFERFRELSKGKTTVIISHRFPTVRMADRILVLERGHVVEDGTHAELVAAQKTYARLYEMQARGYL